MNTVSMPSVGHQAGVLAAGAAEALQGEAAGVVPLLQRDLLDRVRHVGDGNAQEPLRRCACVLARHQVGEFILHYRCVERLVSARPEDGGEVRRLDFADHHVRVRHGERAAAAVAGRAGRRPRAVRAYLVARSVEMQDRPAARRHRVDRHHRRPDTHAGHRRLERPLERAVV